jgi:uncharacterized protein
MHQPIQWHEWGEEAFAAARTANKPMLLDIGAVWCHWCHVMDRESYDDAEVAAIVNENFVAVKVDRDERPDIDSRYQAAVSAVSGQGGWPLTAFLTPDGKPFYGGTYFPPTDGYGRPSFKRVLLSIAAAYKEKNGDVMEQAKMVESTIAQAESFAGRSGKVSSNIISAIEKSAFGMFDATHGGFGQAPKFPHPSALDLLVERYARSTSGASLRRTDEGVRPSTVRADDGENLRNLIMTTLEHMANGGVYDQLAGGFHRYSVDERWVVPHFEKMCYDNSELLKNYVHGYQATGSEFFASVARDIVRWMDEWLSDREQGGFYASQDADISMDDDGDYFTWTLDEARSALTEDEAQVAALRYDINEVGEMHHNPAKNVLWVRLPIEAIASKMNLSAERAGSLLEAAKKKMYAARLERTTPYVDKTVYVGWNAMCVSAYLEAAKALGLDEARRFALRSLDRILAEAWKAAADAGEGARATPARATAGRLLHVVAYSDPKAEHREVSGLLDDYAATTLACLDAYEATADLSYFKFARTIGDAMIARLFDATGGGFFDAEPEAEGASLGVLGTRRKPLQDSPTPAGNPMATIALLRLHHYTGDAAYRDQAEQTLETFAGVAEQFGIFAATYGIATAHFLENPVQVVIVADDEKQGAALSTVATSFFAFNKSVLRLTTNQVAAANLPPALAETLPNLPQLKSGKAFAVLCSGSSCQPPVADAEELRRVLEAALGSGG